MLYKLQGILNSVNIPLTKSNADYENSNAQSYTELKMKKPYIALNSETYINICQQELATCK